MKVNGVKCCFWSLLTFTAWAKTSIKIYFMFCRIKKFLQSTFEEQHEGNMSKL